MTYLIPLPQIPALLVMSLMQTAGHTTVVLTVRYLPLPTAEFNKVDEKWNGIQSCALIPSGEKWNEIQLCVLIPSGEKWNGIQLCLFNSTGREMEWNTVVCTKSIGREVK